MKSKLKESLTHREKEILELIIDEYTTDEIARQLYVSHDTVKTHRRHLMEKLNARNVAGMVRKAFEYRVVAIPA